MMLRCRLWSRLEQLGIVLAEEFLQGGGCSFLDGVDSLDKAEDVGRHNQEVMKGAGTGIPIGVRGFTRNEDAGTRAGLDFVLAGLHAKNPFQYVPSFVIAVVNVTRSDQPRRIGGTAGILPLRNDERIV